MDPFATVDDLDARMLDRDLTDRERTAAPTWLASASDIIAAVDGVDPEDPPATARHVCCAMVLRVFNNPRSARAYSIDDLAVTVDAVASTGQLYLTEEERAQLVPARSGGAFSIAPGVGAVPDAAD